MEAESMNTRLKNWLARAPWLLLLPMLAGAPMAHAERSLLLSVSLEDRDMGVDQRATEDYQALGPYLSQKLGEPVKVIVGRSNNAELKKSRTSYYDLMLSPAQITGSAVHYGYEPLATVAVKRQVAIIALKSAGIDSVDKLRGKRLGLPEPDSFADYVARGLLKRAKIDAKKDLAEIKQFRFQDAALYALDIGHMDAAGVDLDVAQAWVAKGAGAIIAQSEPLPHLTLAANKRLSEAKREKVREAMFALKGSALGAKLGMTSFERIDRAAFDPIVAMGNYTPNGIPGVTLVDAVEAKQLVDRGVMVVDVRDEHEYKKAHIQGAVHARYKVGSPNVANFDAKLDEFDTDKLPKDKSTPMIMYCNGVACWHSYKSCSVAKSLGYSKVYWLRGGLPAWREHGYEVDSVKN
jgi:ABC-type phosphate/phosphonate transport system substrate-binding protein/rhodanese-related sulfurtransferase